MKLLFNDFLKEKQFLKNVTKKTLTFYNSAFSAFQRIFPILPEANQLNKVTLNKFVIGMRELNLSPISCNTHISAMNSFLSWLFENGHTEQHLKIKKLQAEKKIIQAWSEVQIKAIINYKPKTFFQLRLYSLCLMLLDTGCRITEALTLTRNNIDLQNMTIKIKGKGNKERVIPMGNELRKILYKLLQKHKHNYIFGTNRGSVQTVSNVERDMKILAEKIGITGVRFSPHSARHTFALMYLRSGGDLFTLSKILGHTSISTTQIYLRSIGVEHLQEIHSKLSILNRLK